MFSNGDNKKKIGKCNTIKKEDVWAEINFQSTGISFSKTYKTNIKYVFLLTTKYLTWQ